MGVSVFTARRQPIELAEPLQVRVDPRNPAFRDERDPDPLIEEMVQRLREAGLGDVPVVVGGIIPADDVNILKQCGASAVYTPKDFQLNDIMMGIVKLVDAKADQLAQQSVPVPPLRARERVPL
jgi:hypothetical protein